MRRLGSQWPRSQWWVLGLVCVMAVQVVHLLVVAPSYHVGSFDDDGAYLMAAIALAHGHGLTYLLPSGSPLVSAYLPGYPLLLVPFQWLWPGSLVAPRVFSALCITGSYPLLWVWMGRYRVHPGWRLGVLGVLAINTVVGTYASMVMAEAPFFFFFAVTLLVLARWDRRPTLATGVALAVLLAWLVWLKEAGVGLAAGVVLLEVVRRHWRRAAGLLGGVVVLVLPGLVERMRSKTPLVGARYVSDLDASGNGVLHQALHNLPSVVSSYVQTWIRASVFPVGSPLPGSGWWVDVVDGASVVVPALALIGAIAWWRRHHDSATVAVGVYLAETLAYPYTNERRVILVLPVVVLWVLWGTRAVARWVTAWVRRERSAAGQRSSLRWVGAGGASAVAILVATLLVGPTLAGISRDYLQSVGQSSSEFDRSPAMALLARLGQPSQVVETDYRSTVALFTGHRTANTAFVDTTDATPVPEHNQCVASQVVDTLKADGADWLFVGDVNHPGVMDSPCLLGLASTSSWAVPLLSTAHDQSSVFELVGPHTAQPHLVNLAASVRPSAPGGIRQVRLGANGTGDHPGLGLAVRAVNGVAAASWTWSAPVNLRQFSLGSAGGRGGTVRSVIVAVQSPNGDWRTIASAPGAVGDHGVVPFLVATLAPGTQISGLRITVAGLPSAELTMVAPLGVGAR